MEGGVLSLSLIDLIYQEILLQHETANHFLTSTNDY
jgi:hypothetical protein